MGGTRSCSRKGCVQSRFNQARTGRNCRSSRYDRALPFAAPRPGISSTAIKHVDEGESAWCRFEPPSSKVLLHFRCGGRLRRAQMNAIVSSSRNRVIAGPNAVRSIRGPARDRLGLGGMDCHRCPPAEVASSVLRRLTRNGRAWLSATRASHGTMPPARTGSA
jgi:hypothetical protein